MAIDKYFLGLVFLTPLFYTAPTLSDVVSVQCQWHFRSDDKPPVFFKQYFIKNADANAIQACVYKKNKMRLSSSTGIKKKYGISYYQKDDIFSADNLNIENMPAFIDKTTPLYSSAMFMCVDENKCLNEAGDGFVAVRGMTIRNFNVYRRWISSIAKSESELEQSYKPSVATKETEAVYKRFLDLFYKADLSVRFEEVEFSERGYSDYPLYTAFLWIGDHSWRIYFDVAGDQVIVEGISEVML